MVEGMEHIDDLIGKVLAGEAAAHEKQQVEEWLRASESNRKYFDQVKTIFDKAASNTLQQQFDTDIAWANVKRKLNEKEGRSFKINHSPYWST